MNLKLYSHIFMILLPRNAVYQLQTFIAIWYFILKYKVTPVQNWNVQK